MPENNTGRVVGRLTADVITVGLLTGSALVVALAVVIVSLVVVSWLDWVGF